MIKSIRYTINIRVVYKMANEKKKRIFSGVQPSGSLTLGNYLGALRNFALLEEEYESIYCVVDLHGLTLRQDPKLMRENSYAVLALYLACGLDPDKSILFIQSHVGAHSELSWLLGCYTYMGELNRMTQYKDKSKIHADNINSGLFTYPVLMAADILLYKTDLVPVGQDQKQHLELARDLAVRFNNIYGETFVVPEPFIGKQGARIMSLQEPENKMSKSDENPNNYVMIIEEAHSILKKFKRAKTDSGTDIRYDLKNKPGISNLISIYASIENKDIKAVEREFENSRYGDFKIAVAESVIKELSPIKEKYGEYIKDKDYLDKILKDTSLRAKDIADNTIDQVYRKVGLVRF